jgi:hypothetical protein
MFPYAIEDNVVFFQQRLDEFIPPIAFSDNIVGPTPFN